MSLIALINDNENHQNYSACTIRIGVLCHLSTIFGPWRKRLLEVGANSNIPKNIEFDPAGVAWKQMDRIAIVIISLELNFHWNTNCPDVTERI